MDLLLFLACHCEVVLALLNSLSLTMRARAAHQWAFESITAVARKIIGLVQRAKTAYHRTFDSFTKIFGRAKEHLTPRWVLSFNCLRVALVVLALSYGTVCGLTELHRRYFAEPALQWHQQLLIEQAVWKQKMHDGPKSIRLIAQYALSTNAESLRIATKWMEEDIRFQTKLFWIKWLVGKILWLCPGSLLFKD